MRSNYLQSYFHFLELPIQKSDSFRFPWSLTNNIGKHFKHLWTLGLLRFKKKYCFDCIIGLNRFRCFFIDLNLYINSFSDANHRYTNNNNNTNRNSRETKEQKSLNNTTRERRDTTDSGNGSGGGGTISSNNRNRPPRGNQIKDYFQDPRSSKWCIDSHILVMRSVWIYRLTHKERMRMLKGDGKRIKRLEINRC